MRKKYFVLQLGALSLALASAFAAPLEKSMVAADAKWVLHLDFDSFKKSKLGSYFTTQVLQPKIDSNEGLRNLNLSLNLQNIASFTAYGPEFEKNGQGVLMVKTSANVKKDLDALVGLSALSDQSVTMAQGEPYPLYNIKGDVFVATGIPGTVLLAKTKEQIDLARAVLQGDASNLAKTSAFADLPAEPQGFFFVGMAEGFNQDAPVPPQAQILKETDGGRLVIGEKEGNLDLNLVFKGRNAESTTKIQQVLQGLVALVSMTQAENKDLVELTNNAKINSAGRNVIVNLQFPVAKAIQKIEEKERAKESEAAE